MSSSLLQTLFVYHYILVCIGSIAINIEWQPWITLPIQNSEMLATTYEHSIVIIGGSQSTNTIHQINASATIKSNQTWQTVSVETPGPIQVINDNYLTNGHYTYIFGASLNDNNSIYTYDHRINQFIAKSGVPLPHEQAAHPCSVHTNGYIFLIGGVTSHPSNSDTITCLSTTQAYSFNTKQWQTYSGSMPWDTNNNKSGACYQMCQAYNGFIYLFGGVIGGHFPTYLNHVYVLDIRDGAYFNMEWKRATNVSFDKGIINTHSLLVKDTIYAFSAGGVQSIQLSDNKVKVKFTDNDLTPQRCATGNVYDIKTNYIYVIGGEDCNDNEKLYFDSQISQNMTSSNNENTHWWNRLNLQDCMYFGVGFVVAILLICIWAYCCKNSDKETNAKQNYLISKHLQDPNSNRPGFNREGGSDVVSTLSERPQVDI